MSRLLKAADSATLAALRSRSGSSPQTLLLPLPFLPRFFAAESEPPPEDSSPIDPFLRTSTSGPVYAKLLGNAKHTMKSDVVSLLDGCNLTVDDVRVNYNLNFAPVAMMLHFQSRYDFDQAFKAIARKGRLYKIEKADQSQWDNVKCYDGKTLLLQGLPRLASREDVERFLSGCEFDSSSIQFSFRQAFPYAVRMATVNFPSQILAMNAFFTKNRGFCQNNQISRFVCMDRKICYLQDYSRRMMRECDSSECEVESICGIGEIEERGVRLVECLRGRLLAERQASKAAKHDADLLRKRVMELEIKLKEEIELRDRAENKLRMLHNKLDALSTKGEVGLRP